MWFFHRKERGNLCSYPIARNRKVRWMKSTFLVFVLVTQYHFSLGKTYYVSEVHGDDQNQGTKELPFKTIQKAADLALPGDTVFVREGIYRERVSPPRGGKEGSPIVYYAERHRNVVVKGSDVWVPEFENFTGNIFYAIPDDAMFNDDVYVDNKNPFKVAVSSTPYRLDGKPEVDRGYDGDPNLILTIGQVFVNGEPYIQKGYINELRAKSKSWYYDKESGAIYIHFEDDNPARNFIEISTRRRIFAPHERGLGYIVVDGFVMEHCGNQYPTNFWEIEHPEWQQAGALGTRSGHHWIIKNNIIRYAHGVGIDFGNEGNSTVDLEVGSNGLAYGSTYHIIDSNHIIDNGGGGVAAYFPTYTTFTNNVVERNNNLNFEGQKRWESAGVKMHGPSNAVISNNLIRNNYGKWGLWLDQGSGNNTVVHGNLIIGHEVGFDLEIGSSFVDKLIFDNNVLINNQTAIASRESGGITAVHNLIMRSETYGVHNTIEETREGSWSSDHHHYFNNLFMGNTKHIDVCPPDFYRSADRQFDFNLYLNTETDFKFEVYGVSPGLYKFDDWKDIWSSYNGGENAEANSQLTVDMSYQFDEDNFQLKINSVHDLTSQKTAPHTKVNEDYFGESVANDSSAIVGPFQGLKNGDNILSLWDGLRSIAEGELPYEWTSYVLNVSAEQKPVMNVYPNPASDMFNVKIESNGMESVVRVDLFDLNGRSVIRKDFEKGHSSFFNANVLLVGVEPGIYILRIESGSFLNQQKIIVKD